MRNKMKFSVVLLLLFAFAFCDRLAAQTIYVDVQKGKDDAAGTLAAPLQTLQKAVQLANDLSGNEPVIIKLSPGLRTQRPPGLDDPKRW